MKKKITQIIRTFKPFDRRAFPRFKTHLPVQSTCIYNDAGKRRESLVHIMNISEAGVLMRGIDKVYPQTKVELTFKLPSRPEAVTVQGSIARTFRRGAEDWYYIAVKFNNPYTEEVRLLLDFVAQLKSGL